ncbi:hypothetical protein HIMB100_00006120 [SAR116 cluster alpha proteobacterium HIMB100]|nr:hypothetical protein HIMB100_00006120 [SAR116 cluster alpha proteobacterium HIMB100]
MIQEVMYDKLRPKAQEWLYSTEFREMAALTARLSQQIDSQLGISKTAEDYLLDDRRIHLARLLGDARGFDYGLTATGQEVERAVEGIKNLLHDETFSRPADKQLVCLLSNLYLAAKQNKRQLISIRLRRGKSVPEQYNPSGTTFSMLEKLVKALARHDLIVHVPGNFAREAGYNSHLPRIVAFDELTHFLDEQCGWHFGLLRFHEKTETVQLKSEKDAEGQRHLIPYTPSQEIAKQQQLLAQYNRFIMNQRVMIPGFLDMIPDLIHTRRVFNNNSWQSHGRLYGGRYQQLNEDLRSKITINGEPTVELDIKSCHPTMAYAEVGIDWYRQSNQDIYQREGVTSWPRDLVKRCISTLFNAKSRQSAVSSLYDKQREEGIVEVAGMVSYKGWATDLVDDCFNSFSDLQPLFYEERGNHFMYKEGNICMSVIEACVHHQIPVLTLHDSFICRKEDEPVVLKQIELAFSKEVGVKCLVN